MTLNRMLRLLYTLFDVQCEQNKHKTLRLAMKKCRPAIGHPKECKHNTVPTDYYVHEDDVCRVRDCSSFPRCKFIIAKVNKL